MFNFSTKKIQKHKIEINEFKMHLRDSLNEVHLIVSPHFDDVVLSLGGFLTSSLNKQIHIITIFGGRPKIPVSSKWDGKCGFKNSDEAILERRKEEKKALSFLNIFNFSYLNYFERQHRDKIKEKYYSDEELVSKIKLDLTSFLSKNKKEKYSIYVPAVSKHLDHKIITEVGLSLVKGNEDYSLFFYQDMPYTANLISENNDNFLLPQKQLEETFNVRVNMLYVKVSKKENKKKQKAIKLYRSQYFKLKPHLRRANKVIRKQLKFFGIQEKASEIIYSLDKIHK